MTNGIFQTIQAMGRRLALLVSPGTQDSDAVTQPDDGSPEPPQVNTVRVYLKLKLAQVATDCGSTVAADQLGLLLADRRHSLTSIAAALSTTPVHLAQALAKREPIVYAPLVIN